MDSLAINVEFTLAEYAMLGRIVDAGMWELAGEPHTADDERLWDSVCEKLRVPGYEIGGDA